MTKTQKILTCCQTDSIKLECEIDLFQLFDTFRERERFEKRWNEFLESNPHHPKIFNKTGNRLYYDSPFRIGLCVFITLPSAPGGSWGGVAGVQKLIGIRAFRKLEQEEISRVFKLAGNFINSKGAVIAFQKNAWNGLRSEKDAEYSIDAARAGSLKGTLRGHNDLALFCVPPTRLAGPCRRVLTQMSKTNF